jgi:hypothetical protein
MAEHDVAQSVDQKIEIWKPIPSCDGIYSASNFGRIMRSKAPQGRATVGRIMKQSLVCGYKSIDMAVGGKRRKALIHRLVLEAFVGPCPEGHEGSHLNGDRTDNRLENLAWETGSENNARKKEHGTFLKGELCSSAKLNTEQVRTIRSMCDQGHQILAIARLFNVSECAISGIKYRRTWVHV